MTIETILSKLESYDSSTATTGKLTGDFGIIRKWYADEKLAFDKNKLKPLYSSFINELCKRELSIDLTDEEWDLISDEPELKDLIDNIPEPINPNDVRDAANVIEDIQFIPEFVSIAGSSLTSDTPNDIDLVYKFNFSEELQTEITNSLPDKLRKHLHYIPDTQGPRGKYIPLYDLVLVKREDISEKQREPKLRMFDQVPPLRYGVAASGTVNNLIENVGAGSWIVQPNVGGESILIHKSGTNVIVLDADGNALDLPELYLEIVEKITGADELILSANILSDGTVVITDIVHWRGADLSDMPAYSRTKFMDKLILEEPFKLVDFEITQDSDSLRESMKRFKETGIKSLILKMVDSIYTLNGVSSEWVGVDFDDDEQLNLSPMQSVRTIKVKESKDFKLETFAETGDVLVEEQIEGLRVSIHKNLDEIKIFSTDGVDLSHKYPHIVDDVKSYNNSKLIMDAILTEYSANFEAPLDKSRQLNWLLKDDLNDEWVMMSVLDILGMEN